MKSSEFNNIIKYLKEQGYTVDNMVIDDIIKLYQRINTQHWLGVFFVV